MGAPRYTFDSSLGQGEEGAVTARVLLGDVLVGHLDIEGDIVAFTFDEAYIALRERPVLSQSFEDRALRANQPFFGSPGALPTFFRNALPEGALKKVVEAHLRRSSTLLELDMLLHLGADLPGALRVVSDPLAAGAEPIGVETPRPAADPLDPIRFSLSGVQLKASVSVDLHDEDKVTLPLTGQGGRWIAKFPSAVFRDLPENELTMLQWARAAGLDVPNHRLIAASSIQNLPPEFPRDGRVLLVERFDRSPSQGRIHQEDFAQVFGIEPEEKDSIFVPDDPGSTVTYAGIGSVVSALAGDDDYRELIRRTAFMIVSGNGDAHAKNWSLIYPDRIHARLSPLYDVISTVAYPSLPHALPLGLIEPEDPTRMVRVAMEDVTYQDIRALAERAGQSADDIESEARGFVERARSSWREVRGDAPSFVAMAVDRHLERIAL